MTSSSKAKNSGKEEACGIDDPYRSLLPPNRSVPWEEPPNPGNISIADYYYGAPPKMSESPPIRSLL